MHAPPTRCTSTISNGYTNPPEISGRPEAFIPDLPAIAGRFFLAAGYCRGGPPCSTDGRHTARGRVHPVPKKTKKRFEQVRRTGCS